MLGTPYRYGGTAPDGFDCSGLVMYVYNELGVPLPRVSREQASAGFHVDRKDLEPGDLEEISDDPFGELRREYGRALPSRAAEIREALGGEADSFMRVYGVSDEGNWEGHNVLHVHVDPRALADTLGIGELLDRPARQLSGGEQRRVALGRGELQVRHAPPQQRLWQIQQLGLPRCHECVGQRDPA